jgi:hypothetical protein
MPYWYVFLIGKGDRMNTGKSHQMVVVHQHPDGSQEWLCPSCGRRFIMQLPPNYKRTILEPGDENAVHTGGTNGLSMGQMEINAIDVPEPESALESFDPTGLDDPYLAPFVNYLQDLDL